MIHRRDHRNDSLSVSERKHRYLRTCQELLNYDSSAALAEFQLVYHRVYSLNSLSLVLCQDNALAQSQTVRLDNSRVAVLLFHISDCLSAVVEYLVLCSRDIVFFHKLF